MNLVMADCFGGTPRVGTREPGPGTRKSSILRGFGSFGTCDSYRLARGSHVASAAIGSQVPGPGSRMDFIRITASGTHTQQFRGGHA